MFSVSAWLIGEPVGADICLPTYTPFRSYSSSLSSSPSSSVLSIKEGLDFDILWMTPRLSFEWSFFFLRSACRWIFTLISTAELLTFALCSFFSKLVYISWPVAAWEMGCIGSMKTHAQRPATLPCFSAFQRVGVFAWVHRLMLFDSMFFSEVLENFCSRTRNSWIMNRRLSCYYFGFLQHWLSAYQWLTMMFLCSCSNSLLPSSSWFWLNLVCFHDKSQTKTETLLSSFDKT